MADRHTEIGGEAHQLPPTAYSALAVLREGDPAKRDAGLEKLVQLYWKPVYFLVRRGWATTNEDAKDMTQDFFAEVVFKATFAERYSAGKGSFRAYLKGALHNFLAKRARDENREKRGGGVRHTSLQIRESDLEDLLPDESQLKPEEVFDRAWRRLILTRATRAMEERLNAANKRVYYEVFRRYDLDATQEGVSYERIARDLGISTDDVKNYLTRAREEFRQAVRSILCESVGGPDELAAEWNALFGSA
jgi:RNA polymerase sigma factor (sigma-70 family)